MGFPEVTSRLVSAPFQAVRAVFTGIGRVVMAADRQGQAAGQQPGTPGRPSPPHNPGRADAPAPAASRWRSLDETGNVRLLTAEDLEDPADPADPADRADRADPADPADPADANGRAAGSSALPLEGYDGLTLPSIRARLRNLHPAQLRVLVAYESTHAERPEVLGMLERRIEKLEAGG